MPVNGRRLLEWTNLLSRSFELLQRGDLRRQLAGDLLELLALLRLHLLKMFHRRLLLGGRFAFGLPQFVFRFGDLALKFIHSRANFLQRSVAEHLFAIRQRH